MNWKLYYEQNDFGKLYMLGVEQASNGLIGGLERTIGALKQDLVGFLGNSSEIKPYIETLEYCRLEVMRR